MVKPGPSAARSARGRRPSNVGVMWASGASGAQAWPEGRPSDVRPTPERRATGVRAARHKRGAGGARATPEQSLCAHCIRGLGDVDCGGHLLRSARPHEGVRNREAGSGRARLPHPRVGLRPARAGARSS